MTFDINQGQVYAGGMQFDWQGVEGLSQEQQNQIQAGNYGAIRNVVLQNDRIVVQTDLGTMTFTGPQLEGVEGELKLEGYIETGAKLDCNQAMFDVYAALALLFQTAQEMRKASRESRFSEMESVFNMNMAAADKLRESANWALAGAVIGGAISIGMGAFSVRGGMKMTQMATQMQTMPKPTQTQTQTQTQQSQQAQQMQQAQAKLVEQTKPVEQKPVEPTKLVEETKPIEQKPIEQSKPIEQTKPLEETKPPEQVKPPEQAKPLDETKPVEQKPVEQTQEQKQVQQEEKADPLKEAQTRMEIDGANKKLELRINALNQKLMGWNNISQGVSQLGKGVGDFGAQTKQAESKEEEARASKHQAFQDDAKDFMDEAGKLIDSVRDSLKSIQDSEIQSLRKIFS